VRTYKINKQKSLDFISKDTQCVIQMEINTLFTLLIRFLLVKKFEDEKW